MTMTKTEQKYLGIDVGSTTVKAAVVDASGELIRTFSARVSGNYEADIAAAIEAVHSFGSSPSSFARIVSTGYGRDLVHNANATVSEISCHARGAAAQFPGVRLVIDVGGQDVKAIKLSENGKPVNFQMNDRCAAGTGRFLDVMARALGVETMDLSSLAEEATGSSIRISNMCAVFAESEVVGLLSRGEEKSEIAAALIESAAERIAALASRLYALKDGEAAVFTGGGAKNSRLVSAIARRLGCGIAIPDFPVVTGALGAAILASET